MAGEVDWSRYNQPFGELSDPNPVAYNTAAGPIYRQDVDTAQNLATAFSGGGLSTKPVMGSVLGIRAYHGSPYDFTAFDASKIGTGEGAQSYGRGLYFAEHEPTARYYRDALKQPSQKGHMYEVEIGADPSHLLDWDKPLTAQSQHVQAAINPMLEAAGATPAEMAADKGADFYRNYLMIPRQASENLERVGIPGIKYLDQGSRAAGTGTSNYVVFDPSIVKILRKYGIVGAPAGALMGGLASQDSYDRN